MLVEILGKEFETYIDNYTIRSRINSLALSISKDYKDKKVCFIVILNGAFKFFSDLSSCLKIQYQYDFIKVSSYKGTISTNNINMSLDTKMNLRDKHVIIVEDIVDTGQTMKYLIDHLLTKDPLSIEIASLFIKPKKSNINIKVKYKGFEIKDKFIVGYGLDYDGYGRDYEDVLVLK